MRNLGELTEPVNPICVQDCAWCEKDESWVPFHECLECEHNRQDQDSAWCAWEPQEKSCEGCSIPAEMCESGACQIAQTIKKAAS